MARIAFATFGVLRAPLDDPQTQGFINIANIANIAESVFGSAIGTKGFLGAPNMDMDMGNRPKPRFFVADKHVFAPTTFSLWADLESVFAFAYNGIHAEALKHRKEWFLTPEWPTYVAWWVDDNHEPDWAEACDRLEQIHDQGPTPHAFDFGKTFDPDGVEYRLDSNIIQDRKTTVS